jgi:cytochrome c
VCPGIKRRVSNLLQCSSKAGEIHVSPLKRRNPCGLSFAFAAALGAQVLAARPAAAAGNAARGEVLYRGCEDCHSIEKNDVGPMHQGVVGRAAGTVPGYAYSAALRNAKIVWTEDNLDKWLAGPQLFIPGTKMFYQLENPQDRADIIAFLKERAR